MHTAFLDKYCTYHLEDLGLCSADNLLNFKGQCTAFLEDLKELDMDLYRDVMTMSAVKQSSLISDIYETNKIKSLEDSLSSISEYDELLAEAIRLEVSDYETSISEGKSLDVGKRILEWLKTALKRIGDPKTSLSVVVGLLLMLTTSSAAALGLVGFVIATAYTIVSTLAILAVLTVLILAPISIGTNQLSILKVIKSKFTKFIVNIQKSSIPNIYGTKERSIALLLRSDMRSCLKSNMNSIASQTVKDMVVYDLFTRDRADKPGTTPAEMTADHILKCSLTYLTTTIAEMYTSLNQCLISTSNSPNSASDIASLSSELSKIDMTPECQSIRNALDLYVGYFNDLLDLAFKSDSAARNYWKHTLTNHIAKVMRGQHASPIKNAERGIPKAYSKIAIRFNPK